MAMPRPSNSTLATFAPEPIFAPMRILVVEDDKKIASFITNGLKQSGYAVDHAGDGEDALARAQTIT